MIRFLLRRVLNWAILIFLAINLTYFLAWRFLEPRSNFQERNPPLEEVQIQALLAPRNLDSNVPLIERWWTWVTGVVTRWDWGVSPLGDSVSAQVSYRMWVSAELVLGATIITAVLGVALGVYTASRQYQRADRIGQFTSIITLNIPIIIAALYIVILAVSINTAAGQRIFYVTGSSNPDIVGLWPAFVDRIQHLVLPTIAMVITSYAGYHLLQRTLLLDNISADYVRTARAKGLTKAQAVRRHALRTSIIPVAVSMAFTIPGIFTGAILTERIFAWNGMGQYFIDTISQNDIHGVVAVAAFSAVLTFIGAMIADVAVVLLDPRVRVR